MSFTFRTCCEQLHKWLITQNGRESSERWIDLFVTPYVNCETVQGRISNMAGRKLVRYLHNKMSWSHVRTARGSRTVAPPSFCAKQDIDLNKQECEALLPVIIKPACGTNGKNTYPVCHTFSDVRQLLTTTKFHDGKLLIQQYIRGTQLDPEASRPGADLRVFGLLWRNGKAFLCQNAIIKWYNSDRTNNGKHVLLSQVRVDQRMLQDKFNALAASCTDLFADKRAEAQWFSADVVVKDQNAEPFVIDVNPMSALGLVLTSQWADAEKASWLEVLSFVQKQ